MLNAIRESWSWIGLDASSIVATNDFGNVIVRAAGSSYWRICPEELSCKVIANSPGDFETVWKSEGFQHDWQMKRIVEVPVANLGLLENDRCYCLKIPAVLGGKYDADNLGTLTRCELLACTGHLARQIKDLPDGARVILTTEG